MHELTDQSTSVEADRLPRTVAIMTDGHSRWARTRGLSIEEGHAAGAALAIPRARDACELGIEQLALYCFSTENWTRSAAELDGIMRVFAHHLVRTAEALDPFDIRIRIVGSRAGLPQTVLDAVDLAETSTADNSRMTLFVGFNYGGRQELLDAAQRYDGGGEQAFQQLLYAPDMRDPDLIIRTGGERRLSNCFLWQSSYSELLFLEELWPDFSRRSLEMALADYGKRERRLGGRTVAHG
ncbi:Ditrans,polycis-undecaprenyl-diphosphate synthase ((2E,6E)-farnesyl-diphosphate specific) [Mycobacterium simulans]|uniref:Isoprenyl transferase n=1 Tax=Mycobacterium simulans TaxID=627089 RepID=A0A7Z7IQG5_9MYCO|nr:polyprenyl diphosphate synthase [Mycobacterium simulans]SOJ57964.1 Ditrans,polycis-undecaprenyl-diphosphate synthase ((2E,6E)-farnesyl-diphosphate specific) [Mycobacterium simulans]